MVKLAGALIPFSILVVSLSFIGCMQRSSDRPLLSVSPTRASDNKIYIAEAGGRIRALDQNGKEQWAVAVGESLARATNRSSRDFQMIFFTAGEGGKVFGLAAQLSGAHTGTSYLFAFSDSHLLWQTQISQPTSEKPPIAVGGTAIYEAGNDGVLSAFAQSEWPNTLAASCQRRTAWFADNCATTARSTWSGRSVACMRLLLMVQKSGRSRRTTEGGLRALVP